MLETPTQHTGQIVSEHRNKCCQMGTHTKKCQNDKDKNG